jgi:hypothetical protein
MAIRVASMLATSRGSAVPSSANALASQKVNVFLGFTTCAWKRNRCPPGRCQQAGAGILFIICAGVALALALGS